MIQGDSKKHILTRRDPVLASIVQAQATAHKTLHLSKVLWHQRKLLLNQHNASPGFFVILFLKVVFCTKKITLNTTMKNSNNGLSDFLFFPML